jgi:hypothetical protein
MHAPGAHARQENGDTNAGPPGEYVPAAHGDPAAEPVPAAQKAPAGQGACVVFASAEFVHT